MSSPAGQNFALLKKLFSEVQKEKYTFLYDLSQKEYKNNKLKQIAWGEIADAFELPKDEMQVLWKRTRNKFKNVLASSNASSGSARRVQKQMDTFLLSEMEFLRKYVEDEEPTTTNYTGMQELFDEMAGDPEVISSSMDESSSTPTFKRKKPKHGTFDTEMQTALQKLNTLASGILSAPQDPFYLYFQSEMEKLPENTS
ncbi:uncharacterized protein LOC125779481 [Bactrocera dorsalis]|uniref:Uncharacterized protein LOC125779481 n=1 Tax=Bactrocera dorsalis TaxID=27457 RepID=A0ABM3K5S7_BACDO|nr:uncharacterized protein LOC125779481 [Bactrocera dorsalis]